MTWATPGQALDLDLDDVKVSIAYDGLVVLLRKDTGKLWATTSVLELLYIVQRFQNHGGVIRAPIDPAQWRGVYGSIEAQPEDVENPIAPGQA